MVRTSVPTKSKYLCKFMFIDDRYLYKIYSMINNIKKAKTLIKEHQNLDGPNLTFYFQNSYSILERLRLPISVRARGSLISVTVVFVIFFRRVTWTNLVHSSLRRQVELRSFRTRSFFFVLLFISLLAF